MSAISTTLWRSLIDASQKGKCFSQEGKSTCCGPVKNILLKAKIARGKTNAASPASRDNENYGSIGISTEVMVKKCRKICQFDIRNYFSTLNRSASTMSMSSSSSLGSLSSSKASSKGSLSSLSFTEIYGMSVTQPTDPSMIDLHRRVEKILLGSSPKESTLSSSSRLVQQQNHSMFHQQSSTPELTLSGDHFGDMEDKADHTHMGNQVLKK